jgi:transcriptional regulator with XRE-family HTH domain
MATTGERVRTRRTALGLSIDAVAAKAGLTPQTIANLELGRHEARVSTLQAVAAVLDCTLFDLVEDGAA